MVCSFLQEYRGKRGIFGGQCQPRFSCFSSNGEFGCCDETSNYWEVARDEARATSNDLVDSIVVKGLTYILRFSFLIQVCAKVVFLDHIYIDVFGESRCRLVMGLVSSSVCGIMSVKFLGFIDEFIEGQSLCSPIDCGIGFPEPGQSQDYVFFPTSHDVEGYFLGKSLDVEEQITSISDVTTLVIGVVSISGSYRDGEFLSREIVF